MDTTQNLILILTFVMITSIACAEQDPIETIFKISEIPTGKLDIFKNDFSKYVNVFGVHIFATAKTPHDKIDHAASVLAQYLDNDEDGDPDNPEIVKALASRDAFFVMTATEREMDRLDPEDYISAGFHFGQGLYAEETNPGGDRFDAALEEVLHLITDHGYGNVYPKIFGTRSGTVLSECLDRARGGHFVKVPDRYPKEAWFTYDDETCHYDCQMSEYIYWALTSILGAQDDPHRAEDISNEWRLHNRELVEQRDPHIYKLLTDPKYRFPTKLPNGRYRSDR